MKSPILLAAALLLSPLAALAHGPTPQKIDEAIELPATPDELWKTIGDFAAPERWNPALRSTRTDKGSTAGSTRQITLANGLRLEEQLDEIDAAGRTMSYRSGATVDPKALPASSWSARLRVTAQGSGSRLEWRVRAYRADTGNEPAPGMDDAAVVAGFQALIKPALDHLRASGGRS
ncbi:SRPBCC family protein [Derxia lacustris]|uniref:SRPBCC family protein n=1 Tax=Derxia lacustris TaxID=764842 RepID=UPI000A17035C|nr:SRPBCC family protein [Derxia lacustris]